MIMLVLGILAAEFGKRARGFVEDYQV